MPYIKQERRLAFEQQDAVSAGELNYKITELIHLYWWKDNQNYQTINDIIGALEGAKLEFYRRVVVPYEDAKIKENGDVY